MNNSNITCPFCGKTGFDLIGLKDHLEQNCDVYSGTLSIEEERRLMKVRKATNEQ